MSSLTMDSCLQQIRDHATTYVQQQFRAAQDSAQFYQCLMHTLTKEALFNTKTHKTGALHRKVTKIILIS
jgi:hypothetical protein